MINLNVFGLFLGSLLLEELLKCCSCFFHLRDLPMCILDVWASKRFAPVFADLTVAERWVQLQTTSSELSGI